MIGALVLLALLTLALLVVGRRRRAKTPSLDDVLLPYTRGDGGSHAARSQHYRYPGSRGAM